MLVNSLFLIGAAWIVQEREASGKGGSSISVTLVSGSVSRSVASVRPRRVVQVAVLPKPEPVNPVKTAKVTPERKPIAKPAAPRPVPTQGAHTPILTRQPDTEPTDFVVLPEGKGKAGEPLPRQEEGSTAAPPPVPVATVAPLPTHDSGVGPATVPEPAAPPPPEPEPAAAPVPESVKSAGPTRDAEATLQAIPNIPDSVNSGSYKAFVRVKVEVTEEGGFTVSIVTSSGNSEVDQCVLAALKRWKWKPALKDGVPIASSTTFRYAFAVD